MLIKSLRQDLCLDYANTRFWRGKEAPTETLHTFADLLRWLQTSAALKAGTLRPLEDWSREAPGPAARLMASALALRETVYAAFSAIAAGKPVPRRDLALLQQMLAEAPARNRLAAATGNGFGWEIQPPQRAAPHLLAPVLWSAGDLLVGDARHRVRRCANYACVWLFLDESKNATRRWCAMASCGNRAKAQRHYLKVTRAARS